MYLALTVLVCLVIGSPVLEAAKRPKPKVNVVETFDSDRGHWTSVLGYYNYSGGFLTLTGDGTNHASVFYNVMPFGNGDFSARMRRTGCRHCANGLVIRGYPYVELYGRWDSGYEFYYDNHGFYRVYKRMAGSTNWQSIIKPKTFSYAINRGGWNTLRVLAQGNVIRFFINNVLVFQHTQKEQLIEYGYSGIIMSSSNTTDTLTVATAWIKN